VKAVAVFAALLMVGLMTVMAVSGTNPAQAAEARTWVFLFANQEQATTGYMPGNQSASNSNIQATVSRAGAGSYNVRLANAGATGVPIVTAVNNLGVHCQLTSFFRNGADEMVRVGCYQRDVLTDSKFTLSFFSSTPPDSGAPGAYGYVIDDKPTVATYTNPPSYNSTGGRVEIYHDAKDARIWTARFFGQAFNNIAGNVQVSSYGLMPARCGVFQWYPHALGVDAQVRCDSLSSVTSFTPQWTLVYANDRSVVGGSTGFFGYLQADQPFADFYTPSVPRNRAPNGLTHTISRGGEGRYQAQIYGPIKEPVIAHATVNGHTDSYCTIVNWTITPNTQPAARVDINCYTADGVLTDAWFTLNYYSP
jgi:hypothetical protein